MFREYLEAFVIYCPNGMTRRRSLDDVLKALNIRDIPWDSTIAINKHVNVDDKSRARIIMMFCYAKEKYESVSDNTFYHDYLALDFSTRPSDGLQYAITDKDVTCQFHGILTNAIALALIRKSATFKVEVTCVTQAVHTMIVDCPIPEINNVIDTARTILNVNRKFKPQQWLPENKLQFGVTVLANHSFYSKDFKNTHFPVWKVKSNDAIRTIMAAPKAQQVLPNISGDRLKIMAKVDDLLETMLPYHSIQSIRNRVCKTAETLFIDYYNDAIERYEDNLELEKAIRMSVNQPIMNPILRL